MSNELKISSDRPLQNPSEDRLGYATFAESLAKGISKMLSTEGIVIAVYAPWGSGKTTLLNFVEHYLAKSSEKERPVIMRFNPWWFSGQEDLTRKFFDQLQGVFASEKLAGKRVRDKLASFAGAISNVPIEQVSGVAKAAKTLLQMAEKDLPGLKDELVRDLQKQDRKILVFIDDIDRLTKEETRELFRLIKAVADFPNIVYFLSFDKEVVAKALRRVQGSSGEAYLEKIVQVPFELPVPDKTALRQLFSEKVDPILFSEPCPKFDKHYYGNVFFEGIDFFISTPRDVVRLTNTLKVTFPAVRTEVNPADFVAIEALRVFFSAVYDVVRKNPDSFTGYVSGGAGYSSRERGLKEFHEKWLADVEPDYQNPIRNMLKRIFPKLRWVWENVHYGADFIPEWRRDLRACCADIFPVYFRLGVPEGGLRNEEIEAVIAMLKNREAFKEKLLALSKEKRPDESSRLSVLLERIQDYTEKEIPEAQIQTFIEVLLEIGDQLVIQGDERPDKIWGGNESHIIRIIYQLVRRFDSERKRFGILNKAYSNGHAVGIMVDMITALGGQHGKYGSNQREPEEKCIVTEAHLDVIEGVTLKKIREAAKAGSLIDAALLRMVLSFWKKKAKKPEATKWAQKITASEEGLISIIERYAQEPFSQSIDDVIGKKLLRVNPKWMEHLIDPKKVHGRLKRFLKSNKAKGRRKQVVQRYLKEYEFIKKGKNPEDPFVERD